MTLLHEGAGILLDVEGTTSSIRYVYDVLFPDARANLERFVRASWETPAMDAVRERLARDLGHDGFAAWAAGLTDRDEAAALVCRAARALMDDDVKATGLKQLQGLIWREGYQAGRLTSHVYDDVPAALRRWKEAGLDVRIYSSGSVLAQQQFFAHTAHGDLRRYLDGHFDTTTGPKRVAASYRAIARAMGLPAGAVLFVSDVVDELDAAREAGMATALSVRPGNAPQPGPHPHPEIASLQEIDVGARRS